MSACLHAYATIARVSALCEKRAVFAICLVAHEHHFDISLVVKVPAVLTFESVTMIG